MTTDEPTEWPISDELDLHTFRPSDIGSLVPEYLAACRDQGYRQVRIVHGKGSGALRSGVHAILARHPLVASYRLGGDGAGGWGATLVVLRDPPGGEA